ncbi:MAG: PLP-dependent aminotransferase family protein [Deltaproteobacteria bacterium]|jgi:2-aminoadipate transaminase|nr:PLP-dependent aminotransferase family protein [Deltaproteobacteria bacterium]
MSPSSLQHLYSKSACCAVPSAIREINKLVDSPGMKSLAGGWPDPAVFPGQEIIRITGKLLKNKAGKALQYGATEGVTELRHELALLAADRYGIPCDLDHIFITAGSAQGMDLACRVIINPDDLVFVGLPTYFGGTGAVMAACGKLKGVAVDEEGLNTRQLEDQLQRLKKKGQRAKGVYVIPNFQNPTGTTLSLERRRHLVDLAELYDLVIFEDDPYGDLRFEGDSIPPIISLDNHGRVVHMRSMSKTFAPGLRVAWTIGPPEMIRKMVVAKQFVDVATNSLAQYILLEFIRRGLWAKRVQLNNQHYKRKRDFMLAQLTAHFPEQVQWNRPDGGFFIFVQLPQTLDASDLLTEAIEHNVAFVAGEPFFIDGSGAHTFRLSYSQSSESVIAAAVAELGKLIKKRLK